MKETYFFGAARPMIAMGYESAHWDSWGEREFLDVDCYRGKKWSGNFFLHREIFQWGSRREADARDLIG
jgi:hypothetical protein